MSVSPWIKKTSVAMGVFALVGLGCCAKTNVAEASAPTCPIRVGASATMEQKSAFAAFEKASDYFAMKAKALEPAARQELNKLERWEKRSIRLRETMPENEKQAEARKITRYYAQKTEELNKLNPKDWCNKDLGGDSTSTIGFSDRMERLVQLLAPVATLEQNAELQDLADKILYFRQKSGVGEKDLTMKEINQTALSFK